MAEHGNLGPGVGGCGIGIGAGNGIVGRSWRLRNLLLRADGPNDRARGTFPFCDIEDLLNLLKGRDTKYQGVYQLVSFNGVWISVSKL